MSTHPAASLSLALGRGDGFTVASAPKGLRHILFAGIAVASGLVLFIRRAPGDAVKRRIIRRLDRVAPRKRYEVAISEIDVINTDCEFIHSQGVFFLRVVRVYNAVTSVFKLTQN